MEKDREQQDTKRRMRIRVLVLSVLWWIEPLDSRAHCPSVQQTRVWGSVERMVLGIHSERSP